MLYVLMWFDYRLAAWPYLHWHCLLSYPKFAGVWLSVASYLLFKVTKSYIFLLQARVQKLHEKVTSEAMSWHPKNFAEATKDGALLYCWGLISFLLLNFYSPWSCNAFSALRTSHSIRGWETLICIKISYSVSWCFVFFIYLCFLYLSLPINRFCCCLMSLCEFW